MAALTHRLTLYVCSSAKIMVLGVVLGPGKVEWVWGMRRRVTGGRVSPP